MQQTQIDAWQQAVDLSKVAKQKFEFCKLAVYGFGVTIATDALTVILSAPSTAPKSCATSLLGFRL